MDTYKKKGETFVKKHPTQEEKDATRAFAGHVARFALVKIGIFVAINRFAKTVRVMDEKRHVVDLLDRIDKTADKLKEMNQ